MKSKMKCTIKLIALMLIFTSIGGCTVKQKAHTKQVQTVTSSTTKEDKETIKQKQLAHLKEHEKEIVAWIRSRYPKITTVNFDWNTYRVGAISNGVQIVGYNLSVKGTFNDNPDTVLVIDFSLNNEDSIPNMKDIGMNNPPSIKKGKGLYIFE